MKTKLLIIVLFLSAQMLNAQKKYKIELNTGTNFIQIIEVNNETNRSLNYIKNLGFEIGMNTERKLGNHFTIGMGADFCKFKYSYEKIEYDYPFGGNYDTKALFDFKDNIYCIQIPIFIKYYPLKEKLINPYLQIAFTNNFLIKSKNELYNYRFNTENLNAQEELYKDVFLEIVKIDNEVIFNQTDDANRYRKFASLTTGASINIKDKVFVGFDITCHLYPMSLKYSKFGIPFSVGVFAGINF